MLGRSHDAEDRQLGILGGGGLLDDRALGLRDEQPWPVGGGLRIVRSGAAAPRP
jgi:hypothetical protein